MQSKMTHDTTTLIASPSLGRLQENLQDLIISTYERYTNRPGTCLRLESFRYVCGERHGDKYYMRCAVLVKDLAQNENITLTLLLAAGKDDEYAG